MSYYKKTNNQTELYSPQKSLSELANEFQTDKGIADKMELSWGVSHPYHYTLGYTSVYEKYMNSYRESKTPVQFLEIGICDPRFPFASPKLWLSYFKNIDLYCVDNFWGQPPNSQNIDYLTSLGVNFFYADQGSDTDWNEIQTNVTNELDFLVEDGSHWPEHMLYSLWRSIPMVKQGGYYFMEDIQDHTTKGHYGYDNYNVYESLLEFNKTGKFKSNLLPESACKEIELSFEIKEFYIGGPDHTRTLLCVLQKK
jgi:hypothetical protein